MKTSLQFDCANRLSKFFIRCTMCTGNVGVAVLDPSYCEGSDLALGQFQNKKKGKSN